MKVKLTMVGGAAHRRPSPFPKGDLDVRASLEETPTVSPEQWESEGKKLGHIIQKVSELLLDLWGEGILLDIGIPVYCEEELMALIFKDSIIPKALFPFANFPFEYCIGEVEI